MSRVIADLVDGEVRRAASGDTARRLFRVEELTGAAGARLAQATEASGIPRVGEAHPHITDVVVLDVRASAISGEPTMALIDVSYGVPTASASTVGGDVQVTIGSNLITEETITDINGNVITTSHTYAVKIEGTTGSGFTPATGGVNGTITNTQVHRIEVQRPTFSVIFSRLEKRPPLDRARRYSGTVNAGNFLDEPADRWLCNVDSTPESTGAHRVRYTFTLNPRGWQAIINHQLSGVIPTTITAQNGQRTIQVYERETFSSLQLPRI